MHLAMEQIPNFVEYTKEFRVDDSMIDQNNHLNNVVCVEWIQDIAVEHSDVTGGTTRMRELGCAWMIRTQHVEYKAQAFLGDEIVGTTWVPEYSKVFWMESETGEVQRRPVNVLPIRRCVLLLPAVWEAAIL